MDQKGLVFGGGEVGVYNFFFFFFFLRGIYNGGWEWGKKEIKGKLIHTSQTFRNLISI